MKTLFSVLAFALAAACAPDAFAQANMLGYPSPGYAALASKRSVRSVDQREPQPSDEKLGFALIQAAKAEAWLDSPHQGEIADELQGRTISDLEDAVNRSLLEHPSLVPTRIRLKVDQRPPLQNSVKLGVDPLTEPSVVITGFRAIVFYSKLAPKAEPKK